MSTVLVTGATGRLGHRLVPKLARAHEVIALSRGEASGAHVAVRGNFASPEDLRLLDPYEIDCVVHLAAVLDDCSGEEPALSVNVVGTATLMRHLIDRGCRRFVLASSIAACGCMTEGFIPRELPIPDDHPCDAVDAYGMSKALMEELAFYFQRRTPELEIAIMRVGGAVEDGVLEEEEHLLQNTPRPFLMGGIVTTEHLLDVLALAVDRPLGPGARRFNIVDEILKTPLPVPEALRSALGERASQLDLSFYEGAREKASLYSCERLRQAYGLAS